MTKRSYTDLPYAQGEGDPALLVSITEAARRIGIGRTTLYEILQAGALRTVRLGGRRLVAVADLEAFVDQLRDGSSAVLPRSDQCP